MTFPSSVDAEHFATARGDQAAPDDQSPGSRPRLGYFGVIDGRVDPELVAHIAAARPHWQLVMLGPIVESVAERVSTRANLHWLGPKSYADLPRYLAGWDVAILPFALNEATRFINPHQTLECLAAGRPVVSTAIQHVVHPFADLRLVRVAHRERFVSECDLSLTDEPIMRRLTGDLYVSQKSWERIWAGMRRLMRAELKRRPRRLTRRPYVHAHFKSEVS
jgi:glycosyltransferase involved in cell wall biosynthesis